MAGTKRRFWIGSTGPFYYNDEDPLPTGRGPNPNAYQAGLACEGTIKVDQAPVADEDVMRKGDLGTICGDVFGPESTTDNAIARWHSTGGVQLQNSDALVNDDGDIEIITGAGIKFTASHTDASNVDTLDDYEEGSWTPTLIFGSSSGGTLSVAAGFYVKVGKMVSVSCRVTVNSKSAATGVAYVGGLPFAVKTSDGSQASCSLTLGAAISYVGYPTVYAGGGVTGLSFQEVTEAGTRTTLNNSNFSNGSDFIIQCVYQTA